jgi:hypothetical protein
MTTRRDFLQTTATLAGLVFVGCDLLAAAPGARPGRRREVVVNGKRVKTVDVHAHCAVPEALALMGLKIGGPQLGRSRHRRADRGAAAGHGRAGHRRGGAQHQSQAGTKPSATSPSRCARSRTPSCAETCAAHPDRFVAYATVALQHPDLAAEQLEEGVKKYDLRGAAIGGSVNGDEISDPKFHPFWAKAEQLGVLVFIHPQGTGAPSELQARFKGNGYLGNVIGNPLETTIALSHLIFEGTLDKFPGLKICGRTRAASCPRTRGARLRLSHASRPLPGRHARPHQEEAVGIHEAALLRHDGVQRRGRAPPRRRGGREPARGRHRFSVPVDDDRGGSDPPDAGAERRRQDGHPGRHRRQAARDQNVGERRWTT